MVQGRKIKVLIAKMGLDGHDRGAKVVSRFLREAGMEVIYLGMFQTPESIVEAAIEEDVDVIGLSCLSGEYQSFTPKLLKLVEEKGLKDMLVILGGTIPRQDIPWLEEIGVHKVFEAGTLGDPIIQFIKRQVRKE